MAGRSKKSGKRNGRQPAPRKRAAGNGRRGRADKVLAQGAGKAVVQAFGGSVPRSLACWDATHPSHLSLPRAVGPYSVVRTSAIITSSDKVNIFGTFRMDNDSGNRIWTNIVGVSNVASGTAINGPANSKYYVVPSPFAGASMTNGTLCPSAISVQVMNTDSLQLATGLFTSAVCPAQLSLGGSTGNYDTFAKNFVSYFKPRLMTGAKLALRGVQADSYPLSMSQVSEFQPCREFAGTASSLTAPTFTWLGTAPSGGAASADSINPVGWAPIVVVNEAATPLNYLITVEWRVRFDVGNPAVSTHTHHPVASDQTWDKLVHAAVARGHGIMDIVERVANTGMAAAALYNRARPALPMLGM